MRYTWALLALMILLVRWAAPAGAYAWKAPLLLDAAAERTYLTGAETRDAVRG